MEETNKQVNNKMDSPALNSQDVTNKLPTRPSCFGEWPGRSMECGQECSIVNECNSAFNESLFYGPC